MDNEYYLEVYDKNEKLSSGFRCRVCYWVIQIHQMEHGKHKAVKEIPVLKTTFSSNLNKVLCQVFFDEEPSVAWNENKGNITQEQSQMLLGLATQQSNSKLWKEALEGDTKSFIERYWLEHKDTLILAAKMKPEWQGDYY